MNHNCSNMFSWIIIVIMYSLQLRMMPIVLQEARSSQTPTSGQLYCTWSHIVIGHSHLGTYLPSPGWVQRFGLGSKRRMRGHTFPYRIPVTVPPKGKLPYSFVQKRSPSFALYGFWKWYSWEAYQQFWVQKCGNHDLLSMFHLYFTAPHFHLRKPQRTHRNQSQQNSQDEWDGLRGRWPSRGVPSRPRRATGTSYMW